MREKILDILNKHEVFSEEIQKKVGRDRATIYGVFLLENNNIEPTFQRICITCFRLFPESFSLVEFPEHPDSRIIRNCLLHCSYKTKGWLIGSDKTKYSLTEKARDEVMPMFKKLIESNMDINSLPYSLKIRRVTKKEAVTKSLDTEGNIIQEIKESKGFQLFKDKRQDIRSIEIRNSLGGDRYSPESFLNAKLKKALDANKLIGDKEVESYLEWIKENWIKIIG